MTKPLSKSGNAKLNPCWKAYSVMEEDENTGGMVYARSNAEARRLGSQQFGDGDFNWGKARRAPWADEYYPHAIPHEVKIAHGWWYECHHCGHRLTEDDIEDGYKIVSVGERVYCSAHHRNHDVLLAQHTKLIGEGCIYKLQKDLLALYPGVWLDGEPYVYVDHPKHQKWRVKECRIYFSFPGSKVGRASYVWSSGKPGRADGKRARLFVCAGDIPAWEEFVGKKVSLA